MVDPLIFLYDEKNKKDRQKWLSENHEIALSWEKISVSFTIKGNGVVSNSEEVARSVFSNHYKNGELDSMVVDDILNKGMSINRMAYLDIEKIHDIGKEKANKDNLKETSEKKEYKGIIKATVCQIRNELIENLQAFAVYDTGNLDNEHHADCFCLIGKNYPPGWRKNSARKILFNMFSKLIPIVDSK